MADDRPAPLTPADLDLSALEYMPLKVERLKRSVAWIKAKRNPELGFYLINLWTAAYMQTPAASLPNDDDLLCDAAMCEPKRWPKVKEAAMRGFVLCSDGRWYHEFVAKVAHESLEKRLKWRAKKRNQRGGAGGDTQGDDGAKPATVHPHVPGDTRGDNGGEKPLRDGTGRESKKEDAAADARARPISTGEPSLNSTQEPASAFGNSGARATASEAVLLASERPGRPALRPDADGEEAAILACYAELRARWSDSGPDALNWPGLSGSTGAIRMWLREGAELQRDILPAIVATADRMKASGQKPRSFNLFTEDVATNKTRNSAPLPESNHHGSSTPRTGQPEHRDGWAALATAELRETG